MHRCCSSPSGFVLNKQVGYVREGLDEVKVKCSVLGGNYPFGLASVLYSSIRYDHLFCLFS